MALLLLFWGCGKHDEEAPKPVVSVKVVRAEVTTVQLSVKAPATVWPREQANIAARITAPIRTVMVRKGDSVPAGKVLAKLEDHDLRARREEAIAAIDDARANLQKMEAGTVPTDIERAQGQVETTNAALNLAQKIYDRRAELYRQGAIPHRDLLQSQTELAQAKTNFAVAQKALELLKKQSGEQDIAIARSRVEQAKARLDQINAQLEFTELRSPFAGTVTDQMQYPGDMAQPGTPAFTVMDLAVADARAQVPETQLARLKLGQPCEFLPVDSSTPSEKGRVTVMNKAVDPARRTVEVWCEIPNTDHQLRANMFGDVTVFTGVSRGVTVPQTAVQLTEGTLSGTVMVADRNKIAHRKEVETEEASDGRVRITKGLNPGELVIVEGGYGLPDGTQVTFGESRK